MIPVKKLAGTLFQILLGPQNSSNLGETIKEAVFENTKSLKP
jgi:hypothetical protein